jgi:ribosome-binding factor A
MSGLRIRRIDAALKEVLAGVLAKGLKDPRIGFVTVTEVRTSPDLRTAMVYVSALEADGSEPTPGRQAELLAGLESAHGYLQRCLARELRLKRTPKLSFHYDDTPQRAARVSRLLSRPSPQQGEGT